MKKSVAETHPHLIDEWDDERDPSTVTFGSDYKAKWKCRKHGHSWSTQVKKRAIRNYGCPYCSNKRLLSGFNDLDTTHPEIAPEWSDKNAVPSSEVIAGSNEKAVWVCRKTTDTHTYVAQISGRIYRGTGCPYCCGRKVLRGFNDLATTHPELVERWDSGNNVSPFEVSAGSNRGELKWKCPDCSHKWKASPSSLTKSNVGKSEGCPLCSNRATVPGINDLESTHPELLKEWDYELNQDTPQEIQSGSAKKRWWRCLNNPLHPSHLTSIRKRVQKTSGCPYCSHRKILAGVNDLATTYPDFVSEWHPENDRLATEVGHTSGYRPKWICSKGHEWYAEVCTRVWQKTGCPDCSYRVSRAEVELTDFIASLGFVPERNRRILGGNKEIDILIPELMVGIEYNGDYWHNNQRIFKRWGITSFEHHLAKLNLAHSKGVVLYFVWESDWNESKELVKKVVREVLEGKDTDTAILEKLTSYLDD